MAKERQGEITLFRCEAMEARISKRQCQINQELAVRRKHKKERVWGNYYRPVSVLHVCLKCTQPDKAPMNEATAEILAQETRKNIFKQIGKYRHG